MNEWPFRDLVVSTPKVQLRGLNQERVEQIIELQLKGIHDPSWMPFFTPFTDLPPDEQRQKAQEFYGPQISGIAEPIGYVSLAVFEKETLVGTQGFQTMDLKRPGDVETGSWLGLGFQGRGLGTEMRAAVLYFLFEELKLSLVASGAWANNVVSQRISEKLGYKETGRQQMKQRDEPAEMIDYLITAEQWKASPTAARTDIKIEGSGPVLPFFGL